MSNPFSAKPPASGDLPPQPIASKGPERKAPFAPQAAPIIEGDADSPPRAIAKKAVPDDQAPLPVNSAPAQPGAAKPIYTPPPLEREALGPEANPVEEKAAPGEKDPLISKRAEKGVGAFPEEASSTSEEKPGEAAPAVPEAGASEALRERSLRAAHHGTPPPLRMEEVSCRTCRYFAHSAKSRTAASTGECRCKAPVQGDGEFATWPAVRWDSWCGEWILGVSDEEMIRMARAVADEIAHGPAGGFQAAKREEDRE